MEHELKAGSYVEFWFLDHNYERSKRRIIFRGLSYGSSPHFPDEPTWFMAGYCLDRCADRSFKLANVTLVKAED